MNILFVTAEVAPFAKTGGLADVSAALPRQLHRRGHDVRVFLPLYSRAVADGRAFAAAPELRDQEVQLGSHRFQFSVMTSPLPGTDLPIYFVHCPPLFGRAGIYTSDPDEHLRFLLLTRASLESCRRMRWAPDIAHCNDWQTSLLPLTLRTLYAGDQALAKTKTLLTIHNLNYQGIFRADIVNETGLGRWAERLHQDQLRSGRINFLLTGILYADLLTTVSPTYAREIQTEEHGAGLHSFLQARRAGVVGILNGVDDEWDPATDPLIPHRYSAAHIEPKERNKQALLHSMGLSYQPGVPVIGMVSRLASQKGFDLIFEVLPRELGSRELRLVVLGSGESRFEQMFSELARVFAGKVGFYRGFSNELAHLIEAGADMFLMPSRYEPCGLNQMYSLKYGTVPIVRRTGGLADTVEPWNPRTGAGTGFVFEHYNADGLSWALRLALDTYRERAAWRRLMANGMAENFSWEVQARKYEKLYAGVIGS